MNGDKLYELFSQHGVCFPNHIQNILVKLGYTCIQSFAHLQDEEFKEIELTVKTTFASQFENIDPNNNENNTLDVTKTSNEDRVALFGPIFATRPAEFVMFVGEKSALRAARELCKRFVKEGTVKAGHLDLVKGTTKRHQPSPHLPRSRPRTTENTPEDGNLGGTEEEETEAGQTANPPVRYLKDQFLLWLSRTKSKFDVSPEQCEFDEEALRIVCKKCEPHFSSKISINKSNCYVVGNFTRHVNHEHKGTFIAKAR